MRDGRTRRKSSLMRATFILLLVLALFAGTFWSFHTGRVSIPPTLNPWAPLQLDQPLDWLTRLKLQRLSTDAALCEAVLTQADMRYRPVPDRETAPGCGFENAVRIERTSVDVGTPFLLSCRTAVALALWERYILHPAASTHLDDTVVRIEHFGSYACRNVYGRGDGVRSRHATADAIDIAGFVLASGRRIRVASDWEGEDAKARFLRDIHEGACRVFDGTLGPAYNDAHRDHFHLDRAGPRVCR